MDQEWQASDRSRNLVDLFVVVGTSVSHLRIQFVRLSIGEFRTDLCQQGFKLDVRHHFTKSRVMAATVSILSTVA